MASPEQLVQLGLQHKNSGRLSEAEACYRHALTLAPGHPQSLGNLGIVLRLLGRPAEALDCFAQLAGLFPAMPAAHFSLGNALADLGRHDDAAAAYRRALRLNPGDADAHLGLGMVLLAAGQNEPAVAALRQAIRHAPNSPAAHRSLGQALARNEQIEPAIAAYRQCLALSPNDAAAHGELGGLLHQIADGEAAIASYRRALALEAASPVHFDNYLMALTYAGAATNFWFEEHCRFGRLLEQAPPMPHANEPDAGRRIRLGFVSGDFRQHAVANFIWPVLKNRDRERFELYCYYTGGKEDRASELIHELSDHWLNGSALSNEAFAERVRADGIDVLIDLASHSAHNRLPAFARKPAPVQATWLGYAATTGLSRIDYRISDEYLDPLGRTERWHTEQLIRLPRYSLCFEPSPNCPLANELPALRKGHVTFGSFGNSAKLTPKVVALWSQILAALPDARLLIHVRGSEQASIRERTRAMFAGHGIDPARIEPFGRRRFDDYLRLHHEVDIALDMLTFSGVTTSFYTLWMGLPVVTLPGELPVARGTAAIEKSLGLDAFIAGSEAEYVAIALRAAGDLQGLQTLRLGLRERMQGSGLLDGAAFTRALEDALRAAWKTWCDGRRDGGSESP